MHGMHTKEKRALVFLPFLYARSGVLVTVLGVVEVRGQICGRIPTSFDLLRLLGVLKATSIHG